MRSVDGNGTSPARTPSLPERRELEALRVGDERAFTRLVDAHSPALLSLARQYVPTAALAEEVVQETWIGVIRGLDRFQARSSLRTWIFSILINIARTRGKQEWRTIPFSSAAGAPDGEDQPLLDPERFLPADRAVWPEHWAIAPARWDTPEERLVAGELREVLVRAIEELPDAQREVVAMRDIHGWSAEDVCAALAISPGNQRVLLHRGRTKVRLAIESELGALERAPSSPEELPGPAAAAATL